MKKFIGALLVVAVLIFALTRTSFDSGLYQNSLERVQANDLRATQVFFVPEDILTDEYIEIANEGIAAYQENLQILDDMGNSLGLPQDKVDQVGQIRQYTELRIEMFALLAKSAREDTNDYALQIQELGERIEALSIYQQGVEDEAQLQDQSGET